MSQEDERGLATPEQVGPPPAGLDQPAKLLRIGSMVRELLAEARRAPLDTEGRQMLRHIHEKAIGELKEVLPGPLGEELDQVTMPFGEDLPSEAELRLSQAQLMGWLEGVFHGLQAAAIAQQMQGAQMARPGPPRAEDTPRSGQYL